MIKFIDLFAGMGGLRLGFENSFHKKGFETQCVMTSEIKPAAIQALKENFEHEYFVGDITQVSTENIPDFDFLLAGFPCQAFSAAGKGLGFLDTRGTMFFEVERILKDKRPYGFILENVPGLISHDKEKKDDKIGRTLSTIIGKLEALDYNVTWKLINCANFGVPQERHRVFIVGTKKGIVELDNFDQKHRKLKDVLEKGLPCEDTPFTRLLLQHYDLEDLAGKSIKDKRGGTNNIHSWDIELKGKVNVRQKKLLNTILKERRKKCWAEEIGVDWMDGMPLSLNQISTFANSKYLESDLEYLVDKGYLKKQYPKVLINKTISGRNVKVREEDKSLTIGYNIVAGKLSFEYSKILNSDDKTPTLVATDVSRLGVIDSGGIRKLSIRECLRLFGYPESYSLSMFKSNNNGLLSAFDLLGNTVVVPAVEAVSSRLCDNYLENTKS